MLKTFKQYLKVVSTADLLLFGLEAIALLYIGLHYYEVKSISKQPINGELRTLLSDMKQLKADLDFLDEKWTEKVEFMTTKTRRDATRKVRNKEIEEEEQEIDDGLNALRALNNHSTSATIARGKK